MGRESWRDEGLARGVPPVEAALHPECQALRVWKAGPPWRGEAPAGSVLELLTNCTLHDGAGTAPAACSRM